jgi:hypothetical protein
MKRPMNLLPPQFLSNVLKDIAKCHSQSSYITH